MNANSKALGVREVRLAALSEVLPYYLMILLSMRGVSVLEIYFDKVSPSVQADPRIVNEAPKECREKVWNRREQTTNSREGCTGRLLLRSLIESFPLLP